MVPGAVRVDLPPIKAASLAARVRLIMCCPLIDSRHRYCGRGDLKWDAGGEPDFQRGLHVGPVAGGRGAQVRGLRRPSRPWRSSDQWTD